jgi:hypothetical protein
MADMSRLHCLTAKTPKAESRFPGALQSFHGSPRDRRGRFVVNYRNNFDFSTTNSNDFNGGGN